MTTTGKVIIGIIAAIIIIGGGGYYWYKSMHSMAPVTTTAPAATNEAAMTGTAPATNNTANTNALPSGTNNTDASLNQDTAAIDGQMTGLSTDNASANQSVNDQPITQ
jgi:hypothetical protein